MPVADLMIVALLIVALSAGLSAGFFASLGTIVGLVVGGLAAPWVLPLVAGLVPDRELHGIVVIASAVVLLGIGAGAGSWFGGLIRQGADHLRLRTMERLAGGVLALAAGALTLSLLGTGVATARIPGLSAVAASSHLLRAIERYTPAPVADAMVRLHAAVLGDTVLPTIDGLLDESDLVQLPDPDDVNTDDPRLESASESVARVSGIAYACGTMPVGSGFVVAEDRIVTNAHVVAGVETPIVELPGAQAQDGRVVYFDPVDDIAVIAADVEARPLPLASTLERGDGAVVQGHPHGGPLRTVGARVIWHGTAVLDDIYGASTAGRSIYTLEAEVYSGNSGGPLLTETGDVAGIVFARHETRSDVGYAMTNDELAPVIEALGQASDPVSTGTCLSA